MENEIKVEDYIKTKFGIIYKVMKIENDDYGTYYYADQPNWLGDYEENIEKYSKDIIDLIEERRCY